MITEVVNTVDLDIETPQARSSSSEFDQHYDDQYLSVVRPHLHAQLNALTDNLSLETDWPTDTGPEIAWISIWPLHLGIFRLGSSIRSRGDLTDYPTREAGVLSQAFAEWIERAFPARQQYARRIEELRDYAEEDGNLVSWASEKDFWSFVESAPLVDRAGLVLMDNGNLRAIWKSDDGSRVGIQFLGGGMAEFVIFKRRPATPEVSRVAGIDTLKGIKSQIRTFHLNSLVNV